MSTESLARPATETRIVKVLVSCRARESVRATHTIAKGRDTANGKPDRIGDQAAFRTSREA
jgi:hypothetical protein